MTGSLAALALAMGAFVASHVLLSTLPIRSRLIAALGERGFQAGYSLLAVLLLVWLVMAYNAAPVVDVWWPPAGLRHLSLLLMPVACVLIVAGLTTTNPTVAGVDTARHIGRGPTGIFRITRLPVMWAIGLWAIAHLLVLALGGALNSDHRRRAMLGAAWASFQAQTSFVPFQAILAGRTRLRLGETGVARLIGGLALFAALLFAHPWLFGVSPLPG